MIAITREYLDSLPEETILFIRDYIWNRFGNGPAEEKKHTDDTVEQTEEPDPADDKSVPQNRMSPVPSEKCCPDCSSKRYIKWGKDKHGKQRYCCKDCGATFSDTSNTLLAWNHIPEEVLLKLIDCEIRGDSLKETSYQTDLNESVVFNMRQRLHALADIKMAERKLSGLIELDATYSKINLSGTHPQNMPRISKKRGKGVKIVGEEHELRGPSHHKICIVTAIDENDNILYRISGLGSESEEKYSKYSDYFKNGEMIVSDKNQAIINFAEHHDMKSDAIPVKPGKKYFTTPLGNSLGDVNQLHQQLKDMIRCSHGISTRHLQGYLSWLSYTKGLHYTTSRDEQARKIYEDLLYVSARLKTEEINTSDQPIDLYEAYGEYHYGIFSDAKLSSEVSTAE